MGKFVLRDVDITIDGTDLSNLSNAVTIDEPDEEVDATGFKSAYKETLKGIPDASIQVTFFQDFDAGSVDEVLSQLKDSEEPFEVIIVPNGKVPVSATNPQRRMPEALMFNYQPLSGSVGEVATTEVTFKNAGQQGILRETVTT